MAAEFVGGLEAVRYHEFHTREGIGRGKNLRAATTTVPGAAFTPHPSLGSAALAKPCVSSHVS